MLTAKRENLYLQEKSSPLGINTKTAELSDFIAIHVFPYWNNIPVESALNYLQGEYGLMENSSLKKK